MIQLFYTTYISGDPAHHEIFRAKVGKGGIKQSLNYLHEHVDCHAIDC